MKITLPQKNGHRLKTPSSKLTILVSFCWEKNFIRNNAHNFFILSPLKRLTTSGVDPFLGFGGGGGGQMLEKLQIAKSQYQTLRALKLKWCMFSGIFILNLMVL